MGIFEFHFHESEFKFAPSITNKGGEASDDAADETAMGDERARPVPVSTGKSSTEGSSGSGAKRGIAVLIGLGFLVGAGALAKKLVDKKRSMAEADDRLTTEGVEESIEIAD